MVNWWETPEGYGRLKIEKKEMLETFTENEARLIKDRSKNRLYWLVTLKPNFVRPLLEKIIKEKYNGRWKIPRELLSREHIIKIVYPDDYPADPAMARPYEPAISSPKHQGFNGAMCLFNPNEGRSRGWDPARSTALTITVWAVEWLFAYYTYERTDRWPGREN